MNRKPAPKPAPAPRAYKCRACPLPGLFGYGVNLLAGVQGDWYCRDHKPDDNQPYFLAPLHLTQPHAHHP